MIDNQNCLQLLSDDTQLETQSNNTKLEPILYEWLIIKKAVTSIIITVTGKASTELPKYLLHKRHLKSITYIVI